MFDQFARVQAKEMSVDQLACAQANKMSDPFGEDESDMNTGAFVLASLDESRALCFSPDLDPALHDAKSPGAAEEARWKAAAAAAAAAGAGLVADVAETEVDRDGASGDGKEGGGDGGSGRRSEAGLAATGEVVAFGESGLLK